MPALRGLSGARVVALADLDRTALERLAGEYGIERRHASAEALIDDPEVDCVGVFVPVAHHVEVATAALEAGKHVLVEKPLALSMDDCDRMVEVAARSDAVAMIAHNLRFHRLVRRARELISSGAIGEPEMIRTVTVGRAHDTTVDGVSPPHWKTETAAGGGAIMEKGIHHFDLWRFLTGAEPTRVSALVSVDGSYDRRAAVSATLSNGAIAQATSAYGVPPTAEASVTGARGRIDLDIHAFDGLRIRGPEDHSGGLGTRARGALASARALPRGIADLARGGAFVRSYTEEWRHLLACVRGEAELGSSFADGREAVRVATAAARSAREGAPVDLIAADCPGADAPAAPGGPVEPGVPVG
jgi:predicted dehydrogenase